MAMTKLQKHLLESIELQLLDKENELGIKLSIEEHAFVMNTLAGFVTSAIHKYLRGVREHGDGFLDSVDHIDELFKEQIDSLFYLSAIKSKRNTYDKRYSK